LTRTGESPRGFIELKAPAKPANPLAWTSAHDKRQAERLGELKAWATSNFAEFRLFHRDQPGGVATIVPARALKADISDHAADRLIDGHDEAPFLDLLAQLARSEPESAASAKHLAELTAHSARLVRSAVEERLGDLHQQGVTSDALLLVRKTFREVLYAHPEAGGYPSRDFDALFAAAFAQTLAFGLLLVREARNEPVGEDAWRHMPDEHPLMKAALRVLSEPEVIEAIGFGFEVMRDTVNSFDLRILALDASGRDPILYFYEDFLETFDPEARDRYGVFYTPIEVVRYMVGALDRALRENLETEGLSDDGVTILDPATGTGTFLLGIAERVRDQALAAEGGVAASRALRRLAGRMFGFELLVGPYAVAHYRLHHALRYRPPDEDEEGPQEVALPRLGVYLADTLSRPDASTPTGTLGIQGIPIDDERARANEIKARQQILAIIGNPPYRRLQGIERETLVGRWMAGGLDAHGRREEGKWDDLKQPVSEAGKGNQLNTFEELSVAFWRWALWKLFEADNSPQRGVVAFITNRKFLTGWPYAGLRKMMRERFDRIEIIDLRGDVRAGPRGNVANDEGVFNIMVGTAITLAIADGSKAAGTLAEVSYLDSWEHGLFGRPAKLAWLTGGAEGGRLPDSVTVDREALEDFRPLAFSNGEWLSIVEAFHFAGSGVQTKRDGFVYDFNRATLEARLKSFSAMREVEARTTFHDTRDRKWKQAQQSLFDKQRKYKPNSALFVDVDYRPMDRRVLYNHPAFGDFLRPAFQAVCQGKGPMLYTMPLGIGAGPAVWCHGLLPDYHAFRGSYGGYAFPLHDRRAGPTASNLKPILVASLSAAYGRPITPEDVFDAILALLSATSYTRLHAEDLEDSFPHIPFPARPDVFERAVAIGREIRAVETFARKAEAAYRLKAFAKEKEELDGATGPVDWRDGAIVRVDTARSGRRETVWLTGVPEEVWTLSVSGYRVLPRWIEARAALPAEEIVEELRDVAQRIHELIHRFREADLVLADTLADTLTREELGFPAETDDQEDGDD
jgi:predicted helicase